MQCGCSVAHYEAVPIISDAPSFGRVVEFAKEVEGVFIVDEGFVGSPCKLDDFVVVNGYAFAEVLVFQCVVL